MSYKKISTIVNKSVSFCKKTCRDFKLGNILTNDNPYVMTKK